jgi:hypothetical protein
MNHGQEMEAFFKGNTAYERQLAEGNLQFKEANSREDTVKCQEIASELINGNAANAKEFKFLRVTSIYR